MNERTWTRALVLLNPAAGTALAAPELAQALSELPGLTLRELDAPGSARKLAAEALAEGFDLVVAAGGDGTIHEVVEGLATDLPRARLGILPLGTGNDLARSLEIPRDPRESIAALASGRERTIDLIHVTSASGASTYCVNVSAGGFSGQVDEALTDEMKSAWGPLAYVRGALQVLPDLTGYKTTIAYDDGELEAIEALNVIVANARTCAGGVKVAPIADLEDGLLDVVTVRYGSLLDLAAVGASLLAGDYLKSADVSHRLARRVRVVSKPGMWFNVDGELFTNEPVTFSVVPRALRVVG